MAEGSAFIVGDDVGDVVESGPVAHHSLRISLARHHGAMDYSRLSTLSSTSEPTSRYGFVQNGKIKLEPSRDRFNDASVAIIGLGLTYFSRFLPHRCANRLGY